MGDAPIPFEHTCLKKHTANSQRIRPKVLTIYFHTNLARLYEYFSIFIFVNKRRLGCIHQSPINDIIKF